MVAMPPAKRLTGLNPLAYLGVEPVSPLEFVINPRDPTQNDHFFNIGTIWLNNITEDPWILVNLNQRLATWLRFGTAGSGDLDTLTGNTGGAVGPDVSQDIAFTADASSGLTITGNPAANTMIVFTNTGNPTGQALTGDVGGAAIFDGNENIDVLGGANMNTVTPGTGSQLFVHLNDVIRWPNTNAGGTTGVIYLNGTSGAGGDRFMHNAGGVTNVFLGIDSGRLSTTGTFNSGFGNESLSSITSGIQNCAFGAAALDSTDVANFNCAFGVGALEFATGAGTSSNTSIGANSSNDITSGSGNSIIGAFSGELITSGTNNCTLGRSSLNQLLTGAENISLGFLAATNYVAAESSNIIISNAGTVAESNTIRIGTQGAGAAQQNRNFQAGITGVTVSNAASVTIDTTTGQLGVGGGAGNAGDNAFLATQAPLSLISAGGPVITITYFMGTNGIFMTEVFDTDNVFFPGDGVLPASFTAPATGTFQFEWASAIQSRAFAFGIGAQRYHPAFVFNGVLTTAFIKLSSGFSAGVATQSQKMSDFNILVVNLTSGDVVTFALDLIVNVGTGTGVEFAQSTAPITGNTNWICGFRVA